MKNIIKTTLVALLTITGVNAQQEAMMTQYMFNGLYLNPAYAGSHEYWSSTLSYRNQWSGADFKGAPQTAIAAIDGPIRGKNMGLGFTFLHDQIGITRTNSFCANYSYQLKFNNNSKLAFGINAGFSQYDARLTDVTIWDAQDEVYSNNLNQILPRMGAGAYYFADRYYVGLSVPTLLSYQDGSKFSMDLSKASFLRRHYMLTGGVVLNVSEDVKFKPSVLLKYTKNAPLEGDINFSAIFKDAFWIGATYRTNDAIALIAEYQTNSYFRIGYSYDITISGLRGYQNGSHEVMIGVDFGKDMKKVKTPRYF
jgi:type IX secretion system PorP/SprF family membrane protein